MIYHLVSTDHDTDQFAKLLAEEISRFDVRSQIECTYASDSHRWNPLLTNEAVLIGLGSAVNKRLLKNARYANVPSCFFQLSKGRKQGRAINKLLVKYFDKVIVDFTIVSHQ